MAGQEGLGFLFDWVPIASGQAFKFRGASAFFVGCTGADTFTVTASSTYGGSYTSPGNIITHFYQRADTNGTHAWTLQTQAASNAVVQSNAGYTTGIEVFTSQWADPNAYIKITASASGLISVIPHHLVMARKPANLEVLGS